MTYSTVNEPFKTPLLTWRPSLNVKIKSNYSIHIKVYTLAHNFTTQILPVTQFQHSSVASDNQQCHLESISSPAVTSLKHGPSTLGKGFPENLKMLCRDRCFTEHTDAGWLEQQTQSHFFLNMVSEHEDKLLKVA